MDERTGDGMDIEGLDLWYGEKQTLRGIDLHIPPRSVTAIIGPSGCGKSTLLRCLNRMNDLIENCRIEGAIRFQGEDINSRRTDLIDLRRRIGMVFQKPTPLPASVYDNVVYGCRMGGIRKRHILDTVFHRSMRMAGLYPELEERSDELATNLSGGQQQRLCIARALAMQPEVLLFDEPCSALDPLATAKVEETIKRLKDTLTIVIVTHNMQQARRVSDNTVFMLDGRNIETGETSMIFSGPKDDRTRAYVEGRFG